MCGILKVILEPFGDVEFLKGGVELFEVRGETWGCWVLGGGFGFDGSGGG